MRCDSGTEFTSTSCQTVLKQFGLQLQLAEPTQHEHNDPACINNAVDLLKSRFHVKTFGYPTKFLGLELWRKSNLLFVHQSKYVTDILKEFRMDASHSVDTPIVPLGKHKPPLSDNESSFPYKKAIGSLLYVSIYSCPDISYAVNYLSRFQSNPQSYHWTLVK